MIVILARLVVDSESRSAFEAAATRAMAETRGSAGCITYDFTRDLGDADVFHIAEVWATAADFDAHVASADHAVFRAALATCTVVERRIERFDPERSTRLA